MMSNFCNDPIYDDPKYKKLRKLLRYHRRRVFDPKTGDAKWAKENGDTYRIDYAIKNFGRGSYKVSGMDDILEEIDMT